MTQANENKMSFRFKIYIKENWGSPFVFGFMVLLLSSAISLSAGLSSFADTVAVYAYYFLVAGVILQLASFLKYQKRNGGAV